MATDFNYSYHINAEGGLYRVETWTTPGGERIECRTADITEEESLADRREIELAYLEHESELAAEERRPRRRR